MDRIEVSRLLIVVHLLLTCVDVVLVTLLNVFALDIELTKLAHVIYQVMRDPHTFLRLIKGVLVSVDLRQDGTVLKFQFADKLQFSHPVRDTTLFQIELVGRHVI